MSALERNLDILASAPDENLAPGTNWRGILRGPSQISWRLDSPEATQAGPLDPQSNSIGTPNFLPQLVKNQIIHSTRDESLFHCGISREIPHCSSASKGSLTPLSQLKKFPDIPISTQEEHRGSHHNSKRAPFFPPHLTMRVHFPALSGKESRRFVATQEEVVSI